MLVCDHVLYHICSISPWMHIVGFSPQALSPSFAPLTVFTAGVSNLDGEETLFAVEPAKKKRKQPTQTVQDENEDALEVQVHCALITQLYNGQMYKCNRGIVSFGVGIVANWSHFE